MAIIITTPGDVEFSLPEAGETNWSGLTDYLVYLSSSLRRGDTIITGEFATTPEVVNVNDGDILDITGKSTFLLRASQDVTLNLTSPLLSGAHDGKIVTLIGSSDFTITIPDAGNLDINGDFLCAKGDVIQLVWVETASLWYEISRND